ncbi:hypothetical protein ACO2Q1_07600 [Brevundimonas sp. VNH65]|uniref:hypothetical protein n=1 Tax=Brevundimonas sp. VNH65 TaxID=3400917 RepID=UPI003C069438
MRGFAAIAAAAAVWAGATPPASAQQSPPTTPTPATVAGGPGEAACPSGLPGGTRCWRGGTAQGAFYWIAVPADWSGGLVVHAHGGPRTGAPDIDETAEDLQRFAVTVREGYAWIGSTYRRGGYGVRMAAEDTDIVRRIFWTLFGKPRRTILHGQSWGGNVAAKAAELYALDADGNRNYDGVMLTSGVLAGGTKAYGFRADLRAVYQFYCRNHPRADEAQYPLWQGLPAGARMTRAELTSRVSECTGLDKPAARRTPQQASNLKNILAVVGIEEGALVAHLAWGTNLFQDMVQERLGGRNPFDNSRTVYSGSDDDAALNAGVERFSADPAAVAQLAYDADLSGLIVLPTVTIHGIDDPTAFVAMSAAYRETVARAGRSDLLVQTFTREAEHSKLSTPQYAALLAALEGWIDTGERPDGAGVAALCEARAAAYGEPCRFDVDFRP